MDTLENRAALAANGAKTATFTGIVVNHTHWDREWYIPFQRYRVMLVDAVNLLLDMLTTQPDFPGFMLDGQTAVIEDFLEVCPERRAELAHYIKEGRIVVGPWFVLPDEFLPSGESLIRNLLLGRKHLQELGGPPAKIGYLPDTFGHPAQLPQIIAKFDLDSLVIFRGVQSKTSEFYWEAPDGTRLLTVYLPGGYYNAMELARAPQYWLEQKMQPALEQLTQFATTDNVLLLNGCDHFEPQPQTQVFLDKANRLQDKVFLKQGTLSEYVERVRAARPELEVKRGEWRYNRPARITPGVLSARMYLKQADFQAAILLERGAEPLQALAWALGGKHDTGLLSTAWHYLLQNHPHDSICGCSVDAVHRDCASRYEWVQQIGEDLVERAGRELVKQGNLQKAAAPDKRPGFIVFNSLATSRQVVVKQKLHFLEAGASFKLIDSAGNEIAYQELSRRPIKIEWDAQRHYFYPEGRIYPAIVIATPEQAETEGRWKRWQGEEVEVLFELNLPPGGFTRLSVSPSPLSSEPPQSLTNSVELNFQSSMIENEWLRVEVAEDGSFELLDKTTERKYGPLNVFRSEADRGDEYSFCPADEDKPVSSRGGKAIVRLVENGPVRQTLEVSLTMSVPARLDESRTRRVAETVAMPITSRISLTRGRRQVEIQTALDNQAQDQRLRVLFGTGVQTEFADAQGQFQVMRRPVELSAEERARVPEFDEEQEVSYHPQRAFVDVSDERGGLAILNRGLPEYEAEPGAAGVTLGVTLLRCVGWLSRDDLKTRYKHAGPGLETPEAQCSGQHSFEYAVMPHSGDWLEGGVAQDAEDYVTPAHIAALPVGENWLPGEASLYSLGPKELLFSACKRSEDGQSLILRAYNIAPYTVQGRLQLAQGNQVRLVNLAERELGEALKPEEKADGELSPLVYRFPVGPHEIVTLSIRKA